VTVLAEHDEDAPAAFWMSRTSACPTLQALPRVGFLRGWSARPMLHSAYGALVLDIVGTPRLFAKSGYFRHPLPCGLRRNRAGAAHLPMAAFDEGLKSPHATAPKQSPHRRLRFVSFRENYLAIRGGGPVTGCCPLRAQPVTPFLLPRRRRPSLRYCSLARFRFSMKH